MQEHNMGPNLVVWVPAPLEVVRRMLELAGVSSGDVVYDLGSGDGRILVSAVRDFGAARAVGYELRPDLCAASLKAARQSGIDAKIDVVNGDLRNADLSDASVVALYLTSDANRMLVNSLAKGLRAGARVVTYLFPISGWLTAAEVDLATSSFQEGKFIGKLYLYVMPPAPHTEGLG